MYLNNNRHKIQAITAITTAVLALLWPSFVSAQSLQRLFSTPALRAELDRLRNGSLHPESVTEILTDIAQLPNVTELDNGELEDIIYSVGGAMLRSDGRYTVWINNQSYDQDNLPENIQLLTPFNKGQLRIHDPDSNVSFHLKPGQVLNLTTGQLYESYQYRAVADVVDESEIVREQELPVREEDVQVLIEQAQEIRDITQ
ncbi:MAG: hypothetical protein COA96_05190 [SAR86 cluster bacterium]|uniref:Uncharacterized protein n=1 Tax=SAR86 cluster bacterium TaxID=2030880 RepID=A0A2A5B5K9_9GAMM|nr:MAG: hypothetical protein COA96_05190 [SAR86 cluster bacterium]